MPKTIQIRDVDDDVYRVLAARAGEAGISVPELLRAEVTRIAARPSPQEWLQRTRRRDGNNDVTRLEVIATLDEHRGPWPDGRS